MRALSPTIESLLQGASYSTYTRVFVADATDSLVDLSEYMISAVLEQGFEELIDALTIHFDRAFGEEGLAPLMTVSPPLDLGRRVVFETAVVANDATPSSGDWMEKFRGTIRSIDPTTNELVVVCQDQFGVLSDTWIEDEEEYGDDEGNETLENVKQAILNKWVSDVTLYTPVSPQAGVQLYRQQVESVLSAQRALDDSIGWVSRSWWDESQGGFRYTLLEPPRTKSTTDWTMRPSRYLKVRELKHDIEDIRNRVRVDYVDEDGLEQFVVVEDAASIAKHGVRFMRITEGSDSPIKTQAQALALANAALSDLSEPDVTHEVEDFYLPHLEVWDLIEFEPNNVHYSAKQYLAVQEVRHEFTAPGVAHTIIMCRGKPSAGVLLWRRRALVPPDPAKNWSGSFNLEVDDGGVVTMLPQTSSHEVKSWRAKFSVDGWEDPEYDDEAAGELSGDNESFGTLIPLNVTLESGQWLYLTGLQYDSADEDADSQKAARKSRRIRSRIGFGEPDLLVLKNFRETHLGETVKWEWEPSDAVKEVWIYYRTFEKPVPSDPWPTNEPNREPDVILRVGVDPDSFEYAVPDEGFKTYLQFEPRDNSMPPRAGEIQRATIDALPGALPLIAYVTEVPPSTVGSDLTNVLAVITDPMSRAGRLYAWLNYDSHEEADPSGDPDGYVDVTLTDGHRGVNFSDTWQLTGGGTENLFKDLTIDADLGKRIWLEFIAEDGTTTERQSFYLRSHARLRDAEFGEMLPDSMKYAWQFARAMRPPAVLEELPEGNPDDVPAAFVGGKLYRWDEEEEKWTAAIPAVDIDGQLLAAQIADSAITTAKIAAGAVEAGKLAAGAVTEEKLGAIAVTAEKIAAGAVDTAKIANGAVETAKLAALSVTDAILAAGAVTTTKVTDEAITTAKLDAGAVTAEKIAAGTITANEIASLAILAGNIAAGAITTAKLDALAVTAEKIAAGAVTTAKLDALAVTAGKIAAGAIEAGHIAAGAVEAEKIAAGAVTTAKLDALAVTAEKIAAGAIVATKIGVGAIEAVHMSAGSVTASSIAAEAVTAGAIAAGAISSSALFVNGVIESAAIATGAVVADKISVNSLRSIVSDSGRMGIMLTGGFYNESGNAGLRIDTSTAAPSFWGWVRYLDLAATGSMPLLKSPQVSINADGSMTMGSGFALDSSGNATFSGALSAASGTFSGGLSAETVDVSLGGRITLRPGGFYTRGTIEWLNNSSSTVGSISMSGAGFVNMTMSANGLMLIVGNTININSGTGLGGSITFHNSVGANQTVMSILIGAGSYSGLRRVQVDANGSLFVS